MAEAVELFCTVGSIVALMAFSFAVVFYAHGEKKKAVVALFVFNAVTALWVSVKVVYYTTYAPPAVVETVNPQD